MQTQQDPQYRVLVTADGDWAVVTPTSDDRATIESHSPEFPANQFIDEMNMYGWYDADLSYVVGARHQLYVFNGSLEAATKQASVWAAEYANVRG